MKTKISFSRSFALLVIIIAVFTGTFAYRSIVDVDIMEARNFVAAREMAAGGSFLIPTMNGELRLAKPPLPTWFTAVAVDYAGSDNELGILRIPSAIAGLIVLAGLYFLSRFFSGSGKVGYFTVLTMSTSFLFILMSRKNTWDIYAHAFMLSGLAMIFYSHAVKSKNILIHYVIAGFLFACSFMSKGPVSFYTVLLPVLTASLFSFSFKPFIKDNYGKILLCIAVTLFLSALWPVYVFVHEPHSALNTVMAESTAWVSRHKKPFWYYIQFPVMSGLWCIPLIPLLNPKFSFKRINPVRAEFYLIWLLSALILLSLIPEKKDRYLLPVLIPSALLTGEYLAVLASGVIISRSDRIVSNILIFLCVGILGTAFAAALYLQIFHSALPWAVFIAAELLIILVFCFFLHEIRKKGTAASIPTAVLSMCCAFLLIIPFVKVPDQDFRVLEKARNERELTQYDVFYGNIGIKDVWAVGHRVLPLEALSEGVNEAVYISTGGDKFPSQFKAEKLKVFNFRNEEIWTFYKLKRIR
ncbi:MAG: ArnT family glycosyltransferase [Deferribacterales bacterium]